MEGSPHDGWVDLCAIGDVPDDGGAYVVHNGRALAVFRVGPDQVRVLDDRCPHAGGSLSAGHVQDGCVVCPWHAWPFDLDHGRCPDNPAIGVTTYPSRLDRQRVWARIPPASQPAER